MIDSLAMTVALALSTENRDRCISRKEYRSISKKMTRREVSQIIGYPGRVFWQRSSDNWMISAVDYRVCSPWSSRRSTVSILFVWDAYENDWLRVVGKSGTFRRVIPKRG
jgi:hypothetical protein